MLQYQTGQLLSATETNINERVNYTANMGMTIIDAANTATDGTGSMGTVITATNDGLMQGTLITQITVQALATVAKGMVRLFIYDGVSITALLDEINIPAITQSSTQNAFAVTYEVNYWLKSGYSLKASTQTGDDFAVIAEGLDFKYP